MEVFNDEERTPRRRKTVSFGKSTTSLFEGRKPLTPHNKIKFDSNKNSSFKKKHSHISSSLASDTRRSSNTNEDLQRPKTSMKSQVSSTKPLHSSTPKSQSDKENVRVSSRVSSLRRSLRDTMVSPPSRKQDSTVTKRPSRQPLKSANIMEPANTSVKAASSTTQKAREKKVVFSPSIPSGSGRPSSSFRTAIGTPQRLPSILHNSNRRTPTSLLKSEMDILDNDVSLLISPPDVRLKNTEDQSEQTNHDGTEQNAKKDLRTFIQLRRAEMKQQKTVQDNGATVHKADGKVVSRGNGVQIDLSNTFSQIQSPSTKANTNNDNTLPLSKGEEARVSPSRQKMRQHMEPPVAALGNFPKGLWLDFGDEAANMVGQTRSLPFILEAPKDMKEYRVVVDKVPPRNGFGLAIEDTNAEIDRKTAITLIGGERKQLRVTWKPTVPGGVKEVVLLKLPRGRLRIDVHGRARDQIRKKKNRSKKELTIASNSIIPGKIKNPVEPGITKTVVEACQRTPVRSSNTKAVYATPIPKSVQRSAPVSRNKQNWAEQQCIAFTNWLNYTFHPTEDADHETSLQRLQKEENESVSMTNVALRTLVLHQRMAQVRQAAKDLFNSEEMVVIQKRIHDEVNKGRLSVRTDRDMYADLNLRGKITSLLLSYSTPWLRLGLETLFGEILPPESLNHSSPQKPTINTKGGVPAHVTKIPLSRMKLALKKFIVNRVLSDPATLRKYTKGKCKVPSGAFEKKYRAEIRRHALNRLFLLIIFLDRAKMSNLVERVPHLFTKGASVKSSREVIVALCRDFLSAEGDIIKHLSRIGLKVFYKQEHIDEIDFIITNLAVDLRDGVRLARMVEILRNVEPKTLLNKLRLPAVSRLQKLHNVGVVLDDIRESGVPNTKDIAAHHIVDGHREMVLKLMWSVVSFFKLESLVKVELVEDEIQNIRQSKRFRRNFMQGSSSSETLFEKKEAMERFVHSNEVRLKAVLLRWCQTVCCCFEVPVTNFTTAFADGKALCCLLHYYHPGLLKRTDILSTTRDLPEGADHGEEAYRAALHREQQNALLANVRMSELGGIPRMLPITDSDNAPEERSVVLCLAYLFSRLMESSKEVLATIAIQHCYRRYQANVDLERKRTAAAIVLRAWRNNKENYYAARRRKFAGAVLILEDFVVSFRGRLRAIRKSRLVFEEKVKAATTIQKYTRRMLVIEKTMSLVQKSSAAKLVQKTWRAIATRKRYCLLKRLNDASVKMQSCWRGYIGHIAYLGIKRAVVVVQSFFRGYCMRNRVKEWNTSAILLQRVWRSFLAQLNYQMDLLDIITVQSIFRRKAAVHHYMQQVGALLLLQQTGRRFLAIRFVKNRRAEKAAEEHLIGSVVLCQSVARRYLAMHVVRMLVAYNCSSRRIQTCWRAHRQESNYNRKRVSATLIQNRWRSFVARTGFIEKRYCIVSLQALCRGLSVRGDIKFRSNCATIIQSLWRGYWAKLHYQMDVQDVIIAQAIFRQKIAIRKMAKQKLAIATIQGAFQCWQAEQRVKNIRKERFEYKRLLAAIVFCQSIMRQWLAVIQTQVLKERVSSATIIQTMWRAHRDMANFRRMQYSAIKLQCSFRRYAVRCELISIRGSATIIQQSWRMFAATRFYQQTLADIICCQSIIRRRMARNVVERRIVALLRLQCIARVWLAARRVTALRNQIEEELRVLGATRRDGARRLQACYRGYLVRCELDILNVNATTLQRVWRGCFSKIEYHMDLIDIIVIQSVARRRAARTDREKRVKAVSLLQQAWRRWLALRKVEALRETRCKQMQQHMACVLIQSFCRRISARNQLYRHRSATVIQKNWRCYAMCADYKFSFWAAVTIQSHVRRYLTLCKYEKMNCGIILMQSLARGVAQRRRVAKLEASLVLVQSCIRCFLASRALQQQRHAVILLQSAARGVLTREELTTQHFAATEIQRHWRGYRPSVDYIAMLILAIKIQCLFRKSVASKAASKARRKILCDLVDTMFRHKIAAKIQRVFREYSDRKRFVRSAYIIQRAVRQFLSQLEVCKVVRRVILFQSIFRGHLVRRFCSTKVNRIASRIDRANLNARNNPKMQLGARTASALYVLQNSKRMGEIMDAVSTLEVSTRFSEVCCIEFAKTDAAEILYALISTCNRSRPHIELIQLVLLALMNVAKYARLLPKLATEKSAAVLIDLLHLFRDKEELFCKAVSLLAWIIFSSEELKVQCRSKENLKRLNSIHKLCVRMASISRSSRQSMGSTSDRRRPNARKRDLDMKLGIRTLGNIITELMHD